MSEAALLRSFSQADFDAFAALSGDNNPIHVDPAFSAATKFGRTVAHGVLLLTVLTGLIERLRPSAVITTQDVRFPAPTFTGEEMKFRTWQEGEGVTFSVIRAADGVTTCDGRFSLLPEPTEQARVEGKMPGAGGVAQSGGGALERSSLHQPALTLNQPSPLAAGEGLDRRFSSEDVTAYVALGGALPADGSVPVPLIGAMFSYLLGVKLPGRGANYLKQRTRYLGAATIGAPLSACVEITRKRPDKQLIDLATVCRDETGALLAEGRALIHAGDVAGAFD